jgi:hypothetical protein
MKTEIHDISAFLLGVARMVHRESLRRKAMDPAIVQQEFAHVYERASGADQRLSALDAALQSISEDDRRLLFEYYSHSGRKETVRSRSRLASEANISVNQLSIRVARIRQKLELAVEERLRVQQEREKLA